MPKAAKAPSTPPDIKPYDTPSSSSPTSSSKRAGTQGKPWTAAEKLKLFDIVIKDGASAKHFEGRLEGRTGRQCYLTWHNTLEPAMRKSVGASDK